MKTYVVENAPSISCAQFLQLHTELQFMKEVWTVTAGE